MVFDELFLDENKTIHKHTKSFEILSQAIAKTNRSKMVKNEKIDFKTLEHSNFRLDIKKNMVLNPVLLIQLGVADEMRTKIKFNLGNKTITYR